MRKRVFALALLAIVILGLAAAQPAAADDPPPIQLAMRYIADSNGNLIDPSMQFEDNPYDCWGRSDNPHWSNDYQEVHAKSVSYCAVDMMFIQVISDLFWNASQRYHMDHDAADETWSKRAPRVGELVLTSPCSGGFTLWTIESDHWFQDPNGGWWVAETANTKEVYC